MLAYALTIFAGSFLLFQVQPLMGKYLLPWFGGGPGVWTSCLLFFQLLLLAGYGYAHMVSRLGLRRQVFIHCSLLVAALTLLPIAPAETWKPSGQGQPILQILEILAANLGLPYFVLASASPLLQRWFGQTYPQRSPYRLYALSNAGSLLALVSYPFVFEPQFTRLTQARLWSWGLVGYVICCGICAVKTWRSGAPPARSGAQGTVQLPCLKSKPSILNPLLCLLLPACASVLLLAVTNKICQDVAVVPFLWIAPLALYLLSFIICFDSPRWYKRFPFTLGLIAAAGGICWALFHGADLPVYQQLALYCGGLFVCCMVCHGELYRRRPEPSKLTGFYLLIAAGGALGGIFVALLAPVLFRDYYELHFGLWLCCLLFVVVCATEPNAPQHPGQISRSAGWRNAGREFLASRDEWRWLSRVLPLIAFAALDRFFAGLGQQPGQPLNRMFTVLRVALWLLLLVLIVSWVAFGALKSFAHWRWVTSGWLVLGLAGLGTALWVQALKSRGGVVSSSRNFYGVLTLYEWEREHPRDHYFLLRHGRITHGMQFVDPEESRWPTSYYSEESGIGLAMSALPATGIRMGLVGLGTGTLAAYSRPGDSLRIYEINPEVQRLALSRFTYLNACPGKFEIVLGDARLSLEREPPQAFDLLVLDAFSSDAIPVHLLTREAFEVYQRHMKPTGVIAVHISNHYLDLEPVMVNLARRLRYRLVRIDSEESPDQWWLYSSTWVLLTRDQNFLTAPEITLAASSLRTNAVSAPLWTDDFASLFQILK